MKSHSMVSEQENYQDTVEEFLDVQCKQQFKRTDEEQQQSITNKNMCDETVGYIHIVDEYDNVDKFKYIPYPSDLSQNFKVNLPEFQVKANPFYQTQLFQPISSSDQIDVQTANSAKQKNSNGTSCHRITIQNSKSFSKDNEDLINALTLQDKRNKISPSQSSSNSLQKQAELDCLDQVPYIINDSNEQPFQESDRTIGHSLTPIKPDKHSQLHCDQKEQEEEEDLMGYETDVKNNTQILQEDENVIFTLQKREFEFHPKGISKTMIQEIVREFTFINASDECRAESSYKDGGKECKDKKIKECLRSIGKEIIKQVGRKILSGSFNLTQISFPIRAMIPQTALEKALYSTCLFPLYINKAVSTNNLVERFKFLICATLGNFYINNGFLKPLNPILGETCEGFYRDGTRLYAEQISHHPPISYFHVCGPHKNYEMYGNYNYESNAGLNSLKLKNKGTRHIKFKDTQLISYNFAKEVYSGSFMGSMTVESKGQITFKDERNDIVADISIDSVKKKPSDYLSGTIKVKGNVVSKCYGSYMGFIEFDNTRYWDYRHILPFEPIIVKSTLHSDQSQRMDKMYLSQGNIQKAQACKEHLEDVQRDDAKLRKKYTENNKQKK